MPEGKAGLPSWFCAGGVALSRSITEEPADFSAAMMVRVIEVAMKPMARIQVILPRAVAAERPETAPPPPPIPRPPPSDRCSSTTAIRPRARIR